MQYLNLWFLDNAVYSSLFSIFLSSWDQKPSRTGSCFPGNHLPCLDFQNRPQEYSSTQFSSTACSSQTYLLFSYAPLFTFCKHYIGSWIDSSSILISPTFPPSADLSIIYLNFTVFSCDVRSFIKLFISASFYSIIFFSDSPTPSEACL